MIEGLPVSICFFPSGEISWSAHAPGPNYQPVRLPWLVIYIEEWTRNPILWVFSEDPSKKNNCYSIPWLVRCGRLLFLCFVFWSTDPVCFLLIIVRLLYTIQKHSLWDGQHINLIDWLINTFSGLWLVAFFTVCSPISPIYMGLRWFR